MASCNPIHSQQTIADGIHTAIAYSFANQAARLAATGFIPGDVGKFAHVVSDDTLWMLTDDSPITWIQIATGSTTLGHKAGLVVAGSFSGNPKKATVNFSTAFADANYAVVVTSVTTSNTSYAPAIESQLAGSFVINMETNNIVNLTQVNWVAMKTGESV